MSGLWEGRVTGWTKTMAPGFEPTYSGVGDTVKVRGRAPVAGRATQTPPM